MRLRIVILGLAVLAYSHGTTHAQGRGRTAQRPRHISAFRDWRFWTGETMLAGAETFDGRTTCDAFARGGVEGGLIQRGGHSCGMTALGLSLEFGLVTIGNLWEHKLFISTPSDPLDNAIAFSVPAAVIPVHIAAGSHNMHVNTQPDISSAVARISPGRF